MKKIDRQSFVIGLVSGTVICAIGLILQNVGGDEGQSEFVRTPQRGGIERAERIEPAEDDERLKRLAESFDITEEELQAEMDSGKSLQDIAEEHGVDMRDAFIRNGSGSVSTGNTL